MTSGTFDGYRVIIAAGEIDISNAGEFRSALQRAAPAGSDALIISLAGITYLDSNALAVLIEVNRRFDVSRRRSTSCAHRIARAGSY